MYKIVYALIIFAVLVMVGGCVSALSEPKDEPTTQESPAALGDGGGGSGGAYASTTSTTSTTSTGSGPPAPCACESLVEPRPQKAVVALAYTGWPTVPCATTGDCTAVAGCRRAQCNTHCGFCMFVDVAPCYVDRCPGHNSDCVDDADCTADPYYHGIACMDGKCVIQPAPASGYQCDGPGDLEHAY